MGNDISYQSFVTANIKHYRSRLLGAGCYVIGALVLVGNFIFWSWGEAHLPDRYTWSVGDANGQFHTYTVNYDNHVHLFTFTGLLQCFLWILAIWLFHEGIKRTFRGEHKWSLLEQLLVIALTKGFRVKFQYEKKISRGRSVRIVGIVFLLATICLATWLVSWTILPVFNGFPPDENYDAKKQMLEDSHMGSFLVSIYLAGFCFAYGRRLCSKTAEETLAEDKRPPVIYFRSFMDDAQLSVMERMDPRARTEEERFVKPLKQIGPVIAIGNPNEGAPLAGAARYYSSNHEWQSVAHDLLSSAGLVVYRAGLTPGFIWEVSRGRTHLASGRMMLLIPEPLEYEPFRNAIAGFLPLPEMKKMGPIITFDSAWKPVPFGKWNFKDNPNEYLELLLKNFVSQRKRVSCDTSPAPSAFPPGLEQVQSDQRVPVDLGWLAGGLGAGLLASGIYLAIEAVRNGRDEQCTVGAVTAGVGAILAVWEMLRRPRRIMLVRGGGGIGLYHKRALRGTFPTGNVRPYMLNGFNTLFLVGPLAVMAAGGLIVPFTSNRNFGDKLDCAFMGVVFSVLTASAVWNRFRCEHFLVPWGRGATEIMLRPSRARRLGL